MLAQALKNTLLTHAQGYLDIDDAISRLIGYFAGGFAERTGGAMDQTIITPDYDRIPAVLAAAAYEQFGIYYYVEDGHVRYAHSEERTADNGKKAH